MKRKILKMASTLLMGLIITFCSVFVTACDTKKDPHQPINNPPVVENNNFLAKNKTEYKNINGKNVSVYALYRTPWEAYNNPNVAEGIMLKQCIDYKKKYPEKDVYITLSSFHLSVVAAVCVDEESDDYGRMKSLYDCEYDDKGYYRISYLLVEAAKYGINVIAIGHIDASPVWNVDGTVLDDYNHTAYFESHMEDDCYVEGKKVKEFLTAKTTDWTSYGDKSAADMMHLKACSVSNYIDSDGNEHSGTIWLSSTNLDGIKDVGSNGNDSIQTGVVISDHDELCRVLYNYSNLMTNYCGQEEVNYFRDIVIKRNTEQISLINQGRENEILEDEQIVYLGSETDNVFELYFSPLGGNVENWDTENNPYSKYINKLLPSISGSDYIEFMWNNVKFVSSFGFAQTLENILEYSFKTNVNIKNKLYLHLGGINISKYEDLKVGTQIGFLSLNENLNNGNHAKDLQLSYVENSERYYVTILATTNFHSGAMYGQSNSILVIKETKNTGNNFYVEFGKLTVPGINFEEIRV